MMMGLIERYLVSFDDGAVEWTDDLDRAREARREWSRPQNVIINDTHYSENPDDWTTVDW